MRRRDFLELSALAALSAAIPRRSRAAAKARVLVVGGGFAGTACARFLKAYDPAIDVALFDPDERYVSCPMSNEALVGLRSLRSLSFGRPGVERAGVRCVRARAVAIDAARRTLRLHDGTDVAYDRLVVAPGIRFLWGTPEGYDEAASTIMPHAWKAGSQTENLARRLRAIDDGGLVAISVPAGLIRCPPGPYERATLVASWLARHKPRSKVLILDANNHFPRQDVFADAWQTLHRGRVEWVPVTEGGSVTRVDPRSMTLHTPTGAHRVAVANIIPPQAPDAIALDAGLATGHGWCPVDRTTLESEHVPRVHVVGDACIADAMPKAASAAVSQARQCAAAVAALLADRAPPEPEYESVCYSRLGDERWLEIRKRYRIRDAAIRDEPDATSGASSEADAHRWFRTLLSDTLL